MGVLFLSVFEVRPCRPDFPSPQSKLCSKLENMCIREKLYTKRQPQAPRAREPSVQLGELPWGCRNPIWKSQTTLQVLRSHVPHDTGGSNVSVCPLRWLHESWMRENWIGVILAMSFENKTFRVIAVTVLDLYI